MKVRGFELSSNLPNDKHNNKKPVEPFADFMRTMNDFLHEKPIRGFLQSIDEFFKAPFPFEAGFYVNTAETDSEYIVSAELPGVKKEQIHLNIAGHYLTITVENNEMETAEDQHNQIFQRKISRQQSSRTISLPQTINERMVKATYRDGLLQIRIPRTKGKIIEID
ncbi:Hsp20/alpha crystallin family protein [Bacillus rubiinfantis]|uniref:Hsp20/alpha crystallin family protein n=1 Tax=Bacillus rubiinfantis TaxID=1499680 RepID=UPI000AA28D9E|nr:Hsp20/alpha crystallin family protein [Bacillus rubiinfantis]